MRHVKSAARGPGTNRRPSLPNATVHSYDYPGQDEISEVKEKGAPTKKQPTTRVSRSAKNRPGVGEPPLGPRSPTETDRCVPKVRAKGKESFWERVKRVKRAIVRSPFP